jgi:hypothetical protein
MGASAPIVGMGRSNAKIKMNPQDNDFLVSHHYLSIRNSH